MRFYHNKIVWITGASSGIGLALAHELSIRGAKLILTSSNAQKLEEVALVCRNKGAICEVLACDLSDHKQVESLSAKAIACYGHIDVVILNAGKSQRSLAVETNIAVDRLLMELDYFSNVIIAKAVAQKMKQSGGGHIAITSSITGKFGFPLRSAYAAAKHALHGFFESLGIEERKNGIFVSLICPGRIRTPISLSAILADGQSYQKSDQGQEEGMTAEKCAHKYLSAVAKGKREVYIGKKEILLVYIKRYFPALFYKIADSIKPT